MSSFLYNKSAKHIFLFSRKRCSCTTGQAVLALVFLIGSVILIIALTLVFLATSFINVSYGYQAAQKARAAAFAGVYDALLRLDRNYKFPSGNYAVTSGNVTANVTVAENSPVAGEVTITSTASVLSRLRQIQMVVSVSPVTGLVGLVSTQSL